MRGWRGDFSRVGLREIRVPAPGPGEVRVKVTAASLNFPDLLMLKGDYQFKPEPPFTVGMDLAGVVDALGDGVTGLKVGDRVEVVVLDINADKQEISLGMKQAEANPWTHVEDKYPVGTKVKGKVRNMTTYGAFVELEEGIEGLVHVSQMSWARRTRHPSKIVNIGDTIEAVVLSVDKERKRISLGMKQ
ncbi:MAG: S1 RNA-binding domain-containing protein, partial [Pleurocapsa sp. SU_196_0]|nr:S1 RNA-binding domain-containing protein [Pleurocapsa sp. SU_196_0]